MKKCFTAISIVMALCVIIAGAVFAGETGEEAHAWFFHNNPCISCDEGGQFVAQARERLGSAGITFPWKIDDYYAYGVEGSYQLGKRLSQIGMTKEEVDFPLLIAGGGGLPGL